METPDVNKHEAILILVTKNYDRMKEFFTDLGLEVVPDVPQISPRLNQGRGCVIFLSELLISLEENTNAPPSGPLYLQIDGLDGRQMLALEGKYSIKKPVPGFYDHGYYEIVPPDGGIVLVTVMPKPAVGGHKAESKKRK